MNTGDKDKEFFSIGDASSITDVKSTVLRFWETEFEELTPQKNKFGHRVYQQYDIDIIFKIKKLLYDDGYTIKGAKSVFHTKQSGQKKVSTNTSSRDYSQIKSQLEDVLKDLRASKRKRDF